MGRAIDVQEFTAESYEQFETALHQQLAGLKSLLEEPGFGEGPRSLGAEVELYLVDQQSRPVCQNPNVLDAPTDRADQPIARWPLEDRFKDS